MPVFYAAYVPSRPLLTARFAGFGNPKFTATYVPENAHFVANAAIGEIWCLFRTSDKFFVRTLDDKLIRFKYERT